MSVSIFNTWGCYEHLRARTYGCYKDLGIIKSHPNVPSYLQITIFFRLTFLFLLMFENTLKTVYVFTSLVGRLYARSALNFWRFNIGSSAPLHCNGYSSCGDTFLQLVPLNSNFYCLFEIIIKKDGSRAVAVKRGRGAIIESSDI